jgi:hypothetical protein
MSASSYTNKRRVTTIAKATKVQYANHKVSVDNLHNSVIPCIPDLNQIIYIPNPICPCSPPIPISIIDGGFPGSQYPALDGGYPSSSGPVIDFGRI